MREHCPVHPTYNKKVENQKRLSDTEPTKVVVGHCYTGLGIPVELVVGEGRTGDFVFEIQKRVGQKGERANG